MKAVMILFLLKILVVNCDYLDLLASLDYSKCVFNKTYDFDSSEIVLNFIDYENDINITGKLDDVGDTIQSLNVDFAKKLLVFSHAFSGAETDMTTVAVAEEFRDVAGIYLLLIHYENYTRFLEPNEYYLGALRSYYIGRSLGLFLADLNFPSENIWGIGHSLGAHLTGYAAQVYQETTGNSISRLTGIDPAGLCFTNSSTTEQIRSGLADYVDIFHCTEGYLGSKNNLGDVDYYLNSGNSQPGCESGATFAYVGEIEDPALCDHVSCLFYWLSTVHEYCPLVVDFGSGVVCPGYQENGTVEGVFDVFASLIPGIPRIAARQ